jgi:hypothetical protein
VGREKQRLQDAGQLHPVIVGDSPKKGKFLRGFFPERPCRQDPAATPVFPSVSPSQPALDRLKKSAELPAEA